MRPATADVRFQRQVPYRKNASLEKGSGQSFGQELGFGEIGHVFGGDRPVQQAAKHNQPKQAAGAAAVAAARLVVAPGQ